MGLGREAPFVLRTFPPRVGETLGRACSYPAIPLTPGSSPGQALALSHGGERRLCCRLFDGVEVGGFAGCLDGSED